MQQLIVLNSDDTCFTQYLSALTSLRAQIPLHGSPSTPVTPACSRQENLSPSRHTQTHPCSAQPVPSLKRLWRNTLKLSILRSPACFGMSRWPSWAHDSPIRSSTTDCTIALWGQCTSNTHGRKTQCQKNSFKNCIFWHTFTFTCHDTLVYPSRGKSEGKPAEGTGNTGPAPAPLGANAKGQMNSTAME